jgi:1-acyl-sn-glycerol-3-phosphate acyltransferase
VTGAEIIPASGGTILAANHPPVVDSVVMLLMLDRPVAFSDVTVFRVAAAREQRWGWLDAPRRPPM